MTTEPRSGSALATPTPTPASVAARNPASPRRTPTPPVGPAGAAAPSGGGRATRPRPRRARGRSASVRAKLVASYSLVTFLVLATVGAGFLVAHAAQSNARAASARVGDTRVLKQLELDATTLALAENSVAFDYASHSSATGDLQSFEAAVSAYTSDSAAAGHLALSNGERALLVKANQAFATYAALARQINSDYHVNTAASLSAAAKGVAALSVGSITTPLSALVENMAQRVNSGSEAAANSAGTDQLIVLVLGLIAVLIAVLSSTFIVRGITRPLRAITDALTAVADGDLTARAKVCSRDEIGEVASALNDALEAQLAARDSVADQERVLSLTSSDNAAVLDVLEALADAGNEQAAIDTALRTTAERFGWAYGAYFSADAQHRLHFVADVGALGELGQRARSSALSPSDPEGRAASNRALVADAPSAGLSDSPLLAAAGRLNSPGVVCVPVICDDAVSGVLSFYAPPASEPISDWRIHAMRNVGKVVSQSLEHLGQQQRERRAEAELRDKVEQILSVVSAAATGDLTVSVPVAGEDAIGRVGTGLAAFLRDLRDRMQAIGDNTAGLAGAIAELSGAADESSTVRAGTVETVATAAEQLTTAIQEIAQSSASAARVALSAAEAAEATNTTVESLGESSAQIEHVVKMITQIAEQTNMLALNATIEAARAGEAGKGFAVVAGEVKDLAHETTAATKEIGAKVDAIRADTEGAVAAIRNIKEIIDRINELQTAIASAVEEQTAATNEISHNMSGAANATGDIARMTEDLRAQIARFTY